jgi:hypothetical protein
METIDPLSEPLSIPDFIPSVSQSLLELTDLSQLQGAWSSIETPTHSSSWSANAGSLTSSPVGRWSVEAVVWQRFPTATSSTTPCRAQPVIQAQVIFTSDKPKTRLEAMCLTPWLLAPPLCHFFISRSHAMSRTTVGPAAHSLVPLGNFHRMSSLVVPCTSLNMRLG